MELKVQFENSEDITPADLDGIVVRFPFTVIRPGMGALRDKISKHRIDVCISGTLCSMWGFGRFFSQYQPPEAVKTLFQFAKKVVESKLKSGTLTEHEEIKLQTSQQPKENPYDVEKIKYPSESIFTVTVQDSFTTSKGIADEVNWKDIINEGENNYVELKSSLRYCYRNKESKKYIEKAIAKTIDAFLNSEGGKLFIGVDDKKIF